MSAIVIIVLIGLFAFIGYKLKKANTTNPTTNGGGVGAGTDEEVKTSIDSN